MGQIISKEGIFKFLDDLYRRGYYMRTTYVLLREKYGMDTDSAKAVLDEWKLAQ